MEVVRRLAPLALLLLTGATCQSQTTTHTTTPVRLSVDAGSVVDAQQHVTQAQALDVTRGAVDETITVREYVPARGEVAADGGSPPLEGLGAPPVLSRETVTVIHRAPVESHASEATTTDSALHAAASVQTREEQHSATDAHAETTRKVGVSPLVWLAIGAGLVLAALLAWKFRRLWLPVP